MAAEAVEGVLEAAAPVVLAAAEERQRLVAQVAALEAKVGAAVVVLFCSSITSFNLGRLLVPRSLRCKAVTLRAGGAHTTPISPCWGYTVCAGTVPRPEAAAHEADL